MHETSNQDHQWTGPATRVRPGDKVLETTRRERSGIGFTPLSVSNKRSRPSSCLIRGIDLCDFWYMYCEGSDTPIGLSPTPRQLALTFPSPLSLERPREKWENLIVLTVCIRYRVSCHVTWNTWFVPVQNGVCWVLGRTTEDTIKLCLESVTQ